MYKACVYFSPSALNLNWPHSHLNKTAICGARESTPARFPCIVADDTSSSGYLSAQLSHYAVMIIEGLGARPAQAAWESFCTARGVCFCRRVTKSLKIIKRLVRVTRCLLAAHYFITSFSRDSLLARSCACVFVEKVLRPESCQIITLSWYYSGAPSHSLRCDDGLPKAVRSADAARWFMGQWKMPLFLSAWNRLCDSDNLLRAFKLFQAIFLLQFPSQIFSLLPKVAKNNNKFNLELIMN